jgi:hypothetical protein
LATKGDRQDLLAAKTRLLSPAKSRYFAADGGSTMGFLKGKLKLMPGNHDRFRPAFTFFPGGVAFDQVFAGHWTVGQSVQCLASLRKDDARLVVLAVDLTLAANDHDLTTMHFGCGHVYADRLQELERQTDEARKAGANVLWAVHFKPRSDDDDLRLFDDQRLIDSAFALGVDAILCGHTHSSEPLQVVDGVQIAVCGTTTQDFSPQGNYAHLLQIDIPKGGGAAVLDLERLKFDALSGFVPLRRETVRNL